MKSIYILAASILVFSDSVLTADDHTEDGMPKQTSNSRPSISSGILAYASVLKGHSSSWTNSVARLGMQCSGRVSGALNVDTGEFKTWDEYTATEGQNSNRDFYFAIGPWQTFYGECMLKPQSTWWEHSHRSFGTWGKNVLKSAGASRVSHINVRFAGFTTSTSMHSWGAKCKNPNVDAMAALFRTMPGIPNDLISVWDGLQRRYKERKKMMRKVMLDPGQRGRVVGTTVLRVVRAVQVFRVDGWYWFNDQEHGSATTWRKLGPAWGHVYTSRAFVEARGLSQQFPPERRGNTWSSTELR